jgi:hypothetical protein
MALRLFRNNIITYKAYAWLIIVGSRFYDWVYQHFFTITLHYNSSHIELPLNDVCLLSRCSVTNITWLTFQLLNTPIFRVRESELLCKYSKPHCDWRSVSKSCRAPFGAHDQIFITYDSYGLVFVRRPLWREDGSVFCICCWPFPAQSFSGPSPLGITTIIYCVRFETSLFVASYDSQGHGGGIRPRLHTGWLIVHFTRHYDDQTEEDEMDGAYSTHPRNEKCM